MPFQAFSKRLQKDNKPTSSDQATKDAKTHERFKEYLEHKTDETKIRWLRECLEDRSSDFVLSKSSKVLTDKVSHAETLTHWIDEKKLEQPSSVAICSTTAERSQNEIDQAARDMSNITIVSDIQGNSYTHAIFRVVQKPEAPKTLGLIYQALSSGGVALVECLKRNPTLEVHLRVLEMQNKEHDQAKQDTVERVRETVKSSNFEDGELVELATETGFERAQVQSFPKKSRIEGEKLQKWTAEVKAQMQCGKYPELGPWVDKAIKEYMEDNGGMAVETELLVVKK